MAFSSLRRARSLLSSPSSSSSSSSSFSTLESPRKQKQQEQQRNGKRRQISDVTETTFSKHQSQLLALDKELEPSSLPSLSPTLSSSSKTTTVTRSSFSSSLKGRVVACRSWINNNPFVLSSFDELDRDLARETRLNTLHNRKLETSRNGLPSIKDSFPSLNNNDSSSNTSVVLDDIQICSSPAFISSTTSKCKSLKTTSLSCSPLPSSSSSSSSSSICSFNSICFADTVQTYYCHSVNKEQQPINNNDIDKDNHDNMNEQQEQDVCYPSYKNSCNNTSGCCIITCASEPLKPPSDLPPLQVRVERQQRAHFVDPSAPTSASGKWIFREHKK